MDILGTALTLSAPSCPKPTASNTDGGMNWFSCSGDTNSWYGLSNVGMIRDDAIKECTKYGAEVISVFNADIDLCAYYTLSLGNLQNEGAWSSAFYGNNKYQWCPNGTDIYNDCYSQFNYNNFDTNNRAMGDCSTVFLNQGGNTFYEYTWKQESCVARRKFMCRLDCDEIHTTTTTTTKKPTTTVKTTAEPSKWDQQLSVGVYTGKWGIWEGAKTCPFDYYVCGMKSRWEEPQGSFGDDTALNSLELQCCYKDTTITTKTSVRMAEGIEGNWDSSFSSCPSNQFVCGMQVRNEDTAADNTALNGVEVRCCDKKIWANTSVVKIQEGEFGKWKNLVTCPSDYYYVCGLEMQIEPYQGGKAWEDDTAANGIRMVCCHI